MIVNKLLNYNSSRYSDDNHDGDIKEIDKDLVTIVNCLQGRVRFGSGNDGSDGENMSGQWQVVADTGTANTEFSVTHTVGAVPVGYLVTKINKGGVVYDSGTTWTSTTIYLKCTSANATVSLFLLK